MSRYDEILSQLRLEAKVMIELKTVIEGFERRAEVEIPKLFWALVKEEGYSFVDARARVEHDCIQIWKKGTIRDAFPIEAKDPVKSKAGKLGRRKQLELIQIRSNTYEPNHEQADLPNFICSNDRQAPCTSFRYNKGIEMFTFTEGQISSIEQVISNNLESKPEQADLKDIEVEIRKVVLSDDKPCVNAQLLSVAERLALRATVIACRRLLFELTCHLEHVESERDMYGRLYQSSINNTGNITQAKYL